MLQAAGFEVKHIVKVTTFVTEPGQTAETVRAMAIRLVGVASISTPCPALA